MRRFLALSRSTHGILDVALPGFAALLWLGTVPAWPVLALSLFTAVAGYTAIYALNDLVGVKADQEKFAIAGINPGYAVEASALRYPLAQKLLSVRSGLAWFGFWYALTLIGAWLINPPIVLVVLAAAVLEIAYCLLLKVTWWRTLAKIRITRRSRGFATAGFARFRSPLSYGVLRHLPPQFLLQRVCIHALKRDSQPACRRPPAP